MVPKVRRFAVVGLFEAGMLEYDSALAFIGLPEAELTLAHATLYIATAPKSNARKRAVSSMVPEPMTRDAGTPSFAA